MLVIQHLWTQWTKASRPASAARPRLIEAEPLPLPGSPGPAGQAWVHEVRQSERTRFERLSAAQWATPDSWSRMHHSNSLGWSVRAGGVVDLRLGRPSPGLLQSRWPDGLRSPLLILVPGETAHIVWNGRFRNSLGGSNRGSFYEEHTLLVAASAPTIDLFVGKTPDHTIDLTARIY